MSKARWFVRLCCVNLGLLILVGLATKAVHSPAAEVQGQGRQPPVLTAFAINDGATTAPAGSAVLLVHTVVGTPPTDYRVSDRADFVGASWQPYQVRPSLSPPAGPGSPQCGTPRSAHRLRLFLQVRSTLGQDVRIVNGQRTLVPLTAESNVLADSICLVGK